LNSACYLKALPLFEKLANKAGLAGLLGHIGVLYIEQQNYPKALAYNLEAL